MSPQPVRPLLETRALSVRLPGARADVLAGVSLAVAPGEIVDLTGPSGAGKSMLLRALARALPAHIEGELFLDGAPAAEVAPERWRAQVALLPQRPVLVDGTVRDNLTVPWRLAIRKDDAFPTDPALRQALDDVLLTDVGLDEHASRLSVGQQSRVALLRVLLVRPRVLLLDEPDAALDADSASALSAMLSAFAARGGTVLRARHRPDDGLASRRYVVRDGTLREEPVR